MARPRIAVLFLVFAIGVVLAKPAEEKYTTKYDNVDVNEILNNPRLFTNYVNCLLDKGNCTPEGKELKAHVGDALQTDCKKCSEKQKDLAEKIFEKLITEHENDYKQLEKLYDPEGAYSKKYKERLDKIKAKSN